MTSIVKGLFGGKSKAEGILQRFSPAGFSSPGMSGSFANNRFTVTRGAPTDTALSDFRGAALAQGDALRSGASAVGAFIPQLGGLRTRLGSLGERIRQGISGLRPSLASLRGDVANLRGQLRPGFGNLTRSRVEELRNNRGRAVGNLREELSRRRVLGSSFAQREIGAMEAEFARQEDLVRSESMLQEIDATNQLISQELGLVGAEAGLFGQEADIESGLVGQEAGLISGQIGVAGSQYEMIARSFDSSIAAAQQALNQLNLETSLAAGLGESASNLINANLTAQAQARASQEAGAAEFLGTIIGAFAPTKFAPKPKVV